MINLGTFFNKIGYGYYWVTIKENHIDIKGGNFKTKVFNIPWTVFNVFNLFHYNNSSFHNVQQKPNWRVEFSGVSGGKNIV